MAAKKLYAATPVPRIELAAYGYSFVDASYGRGPTSDDADQLIKYLASSPEYFGCTWNTESRSFAETKLPEELLGNETLKSLIQLYSKEVAGFSGQVRFNLRTRQSLDYQVAHHDNSCVTAIILLEKNNVKGAETEITDRTFNTLDRGSLDKPFDALVINDTLLKHKVLEGTPAYKTSERLDQDGQPIADKAARRMVLILEFEPRSDNATRYEVPPYTQTLSPTCAPGELPLTRPQR